MAEETEKNKPFSKRTSIPNLAVLLRVYFDGFTAAGKLYKVKLESSENTTFLAAIPHPREQPSSWNSIAEAGSN